jgi:hypothetical protein
VFSAKAAERLSAASTVFRVSSNSTLPKLKVVKDVAVLMKEQKEVTLTAVSLRSLIVEWMNFWHLPPAIRRNEACLQNDHCNGQAMNTRKIVLKGD